MSYSQAFLRVIALVLQHEGKFTKRREDRGNWTSGQIGVGELKGTNFGISAMSFPDEDIANLTVERATFLYHRDYWSPVRGDDLPLPVAGPVMDAAVNCGVGAAARFLQRALLVKDDGVIGPVTIHAAHNARDHVALAAKMTRLRLIAHTTMKDWPNSRDSWVQLSIDFSIWAARAAMPTTSLPTL